MSANPLVLELFRRWLQVREAGAPVALEELCSDHPELLAELKEQIDSWEGTQASLPTRRQDAITPQLDTPANGRRPSPDSPHPTEARYRMLRFHAKGGLGEVFVAEDGELHRQVALKRLQALRADDPESRRRFLLEAEITGRLEHPGVVPVYGLIHDGEGNPFYAMRFVQGETLQRAIERLHGRNAMAEATTPTRDAEWSGSRSARRAAPVQAEPTPGLRQLLGRFVHVCNTIGYAHSRGILHRDLKPTNIMLGKYGETLVMDWGLAKPISMQAGAAEATSRVDNVEEKLTPNSSLADSATQTGRAIGTPAYMSPEQASGSWDKVGPASDIYGLGATLYSILTGQTPFLGRVALDQVRRGDFPPPRLVKKTVPRALEAVCLKAMALRPEDRYATALDLAADIERWLADEPVHAWQEPWTVRLRRWTSRHRAWVLSGAAAILVAALVLAGTAIMLSAAWKREHQARTEADEGLLREQQARAEADEAFRVARETVDRYYTEVSEELLLNQPGMDELRKKMLANARQHYERFVEQRRHDVTLRAELGRAYWRLAFITGETESKARASELYRDAIQVFAGLVQAEPKNKEYQVVLGKIHSDLGFLETELSRYEAAENALREAARLFQALADADPSQPAFQRNLAAAYHNLGLLHRTRRQPAEAVLAYEKALKIREGLAATKPEVRLHQRELATTLNNLGVLQRGERRPKDALEPLERALDIRRQLASAYPHVAKYQDELAGTLNNLSLVYGDLHQPESRIEAQEQAVAIWERLTQLYPHALDYQRNLVGGLNTMGFLYGNVKQHEKAAAAFQKAIAKLETLTSEHPEQPDFALRLGATSCNFGNELKYAGKARESLAWFDRAEQVLKDLLRNPSPPARARDDLRNTYMGRAEARALVGRFDDALADWDRCMELASERGRNSLRLYRAGTWARMGEHVKAANEARTLTSGENVPAGMLYNSACVYALCSAQVAQDAGLPTPQREKLTEDYALLALQQLRRIRDADLRSPALSERLKHDTDLDSLRKRPAFNTLLQEMGLAPTNAPQSPPEPSPEPSPKPG